MRRAVTGGRLRSRSSELARIKRVVRYSIRFTRVVRKITQADAARAAGIGIGALIRIETGRQVPSLVHLYRLAWAYNVSVRSFMP
jgi:transcriptional regulator with XRE-family HTH domain